MNILGFQTNPFDIPYLLHMSQKSALDPIPRLGWCEFNKRFHANNKLNSLKKKNQYQYCENMNEKKNPVG
jgi:hypothetical protein